MSLPIVAEFRSTLEELRDEGRLPGELVEGTVEFIEQVLPFIKDQDDHVVAIGDVASFLGYASKRREANKQA